MVKKDQQHCTNDGYYHDDDNDNNDDDDECQGLINVQLDDDESSKKLLRPRIVHQYRYGLISLVQTISIRWLSTSKVTKRCIIITFILLILHWLIILYDCIFQTYELPTTSTLTPTTTTNDDFKIFNDSPSSSAVATTTTFSIVINTYKREQRLYDSVIHYGQTCGTTVGIDTIYIIWAEEDTIPPKPDSFYNKYDSINKQQQPSFFRRKIQNNSTSTTASSNRVNIQIVPVKNSLNNRFLPLPKQATNKLQNDYYNGQQRAIFMVDDDIRVSCQSLQNAFRAWTKSPLSMVGFYPRRIQSSILINKNNKNNKLVYQPWSIVYLYNSMNVILTKACFLHERYMEMYTSNTIHPIEIKNYIDLHKNCEDIAMSMLVANITKYENRNRIMMVQQASSRGKDNNNYENNNNIIVKPVRPIYVQGTVIDEGHFNGISTGSGHMGHRSQCVNDITAIYNKYGWGTPLDDTFTLDETSYLQHKPKFLHPYLSRPSNIFEWIALINL